MTTAPPTPNVLVKTDPATGEVVGEVLISSAQEVRDAVARARGAQPAWAALPFETRCELLAQGAERLGERVDEVASLVTREMGKPLADAQRETAGWVKSTPELLEEVGRALAPEIIPGETNETHLVRDPLGVVAAITPWNFPVGMPLQIVLPALAAGNTVVFKPSEHVPFVGSALHEIFSANLPDGVFELLQGAGDVGAELVGAGIDMIGFVGSRATGKRIMESAARDLKRLVLELGGKDPLIVFADADLESAAECAVRHALRNTGQVCCSIERIYVADEIADEFQDLVLAKAREWKHGNGFEVGVRMGPMVTAQQRSIVDEHVRDAVAHGARVLLGGELPEGPGYFYPATVLSGVGQEFRITQEETFGPVVSLTRFDGTEEEAVRLANDTPYGLGANVWTQDRARGVRVASQLRSGQVGVNQYLAGAPGTPWVGARQSGFGFLGGIEGHRQFTVPKSISFAK